MLLFSRGVEIALGCPEVLGARMTGGGFGGCTVNLVRKEHTQETADMIRADYRKATGIEPEFLFSSPPTAPLAWPARFPAEYETDHPSYLSPLDSKIANGKFPKLS